MDIHEYAYFRTLLRDLYLERKRKDARYPDRVYQLNINLLPLSRVPSDG